MRFELRFLQGLGFGIFSKGFWARQALPSLRFSATLCELLKPVWHCSCQIPFHRCGMYSRSMASTSLRSVTLKSTVILMLVMLHVMSLSFNQESMEQSRLTKSSSPKQLIILGFMGSFCKSANMWKNVCSLICGAGTFHLQAIYILCNMYVICSARVFGLNLYRRLPAQNASYARYR